MGFWSGLGKVAGIAGSVLAAPATGGVSLGAIPGILKTVGNVAGKLGPLGQDASAIAGGRAAGRMTDAELGQRQDQIGLQRYNAGLGAADVDLARRKYALSAPAARGRQSVQGDILANAQDVNISAPGIRIPQISGGLRPSMFSANTRALGGELSKDALADQMKGDAFDPLGAPPTQTPLPQPGATDKILQTAGYIGALAPDFMELLNRYKRRPEQAYQEPSDTAGYG
jgi:hypothetical protein